MSNVQQLIVAIFGFVNLIVFALGLFNSIKKRNPFGSTTLLSPLGIFVWMDAVVFAAFWAVSSVISFLLNDWILFLLIFSVFWIVRSVGETLYWLNQQFSPVIRNKIENLFAYSVVKDEQAIWVIYQIVNQCVAVVSIISSVYLFRIWLNQI